jgi:two-component system NarL family response regulator
MDDRSPRAEDLRLLVVDDHALDREGLLALLWMAGGIEAVAVAADQAVRMTQHFTPHVILIKIDRTSSEALELAGSLLECAVTASLLFLDEEIRPTNVRAALRLGAAGYWTRHASFEQLVAAIGSVAAGQSAFCPGVAEYLVEGEGPHGLQFKPPLRWLTMASDPPGDRGRATEDRESCENP